MAQGAKPCPIGFILLCRVGLSAECGDGLVDFVDEFLRLSVLVVTAFLLALVLVVGISTKCRTPPGEGGG